MSEEELVISGLSGRFPLSRSINEFAENLLNGVDMLTEDEKRWPPGLFNLPRRHGKIDDIDRFDADFFGIPGKHAEIMDPQMRVLLEVAYEAIFDSGINPADVRGQEIGVFVTASPGDANCAAFSNYDSSKYAVGGTAGTMMANRLSFSLDLRGPSITIDTACASSISAVDQAFHSIKSGRCVAAIVGGVCLTLNPAVAEKFNKMSMLSPDGKCKTFDASADGFARSEACSVIFIQKARDAKRIYAKIINVKTNADGHKGTGVSFPSYKMQRKLIEDTYKEREINPREVEYVETHGTGTKAGDPAELKAIAEVFCTGRNGPLLVGSTKSNMGHSEFAAGLCSLVKVLIAYDREIIPPNLHLERINPEIEALVDGLVKPVTEKIKFIGGYVGINSFGFGGTNVHLIVQSHEKKKTNESLDIIPVTHPRLITVCGRTDEAVIAALDFIRNNQSELTREFLALMSDLSKTEPESGMKSRGFTLLDDKNSTRTIVKEVSRVVKKRPLWFILPGMGGQWAAMGLRLLQLPQFEASIKQFALILEEKHVNLISLLNSNDPQLLADLVNRLVMVASVQGALLDLLSSLGVKADGFVGHSQGEIACAYASDSLNKRQFIMSVYWRAKCCQLAELSGGMMAEVAMSVKECEKRIPKEVSIACFNSCKSLTLSGPEAFLKPFVESLESDGISVREVSSCGVAFHSSHVSSTRNILLEELRKEIPAPVKRSDRWISSSFPQDRWTDEESQSASAEYLVHNFLSPVLFADAVSHIPKDSIILEVSPKSLFKSILNQCLGTYSTHLCLMNQSSPDQIVHLLETLGKLYNLGLNLNLEILHPNFQYPAPKTTPSISSLMRWDHSRSFFVPKYPEYFNSGKIRKTIDLSEPSDAYLAGHKVDGRVIFPATGYIKLAWKAYAKTLGKNWSEVPVKLLNVHLQRACYLPENGPVALVTHVLPSTGDFAITQNDDLLASGKIAQLSTTQTNLSVENVNSRDIITPSLSLNDIYRELRVRGYDYGPDFRCIESSSFDGSQSILRWTGEWISFADSLLQTILLSINNRALHLPVKIKEIKCDLKELLSLEKGSLVRASYNLALQEVSGGGIVIKGFSMSSALRRSVDYSHESYSFIPNIDDDFKCEETMDYIDTCSSFASAILKKAKRENEAASIGNVVNFDVENYKGIYLSVLETKEKKLLKCLGKLMDQYDINENNFNGILDAIREENREEIKGDMLQKPLTSECILRPMIRIVTENTPMKLVNVLEINRSGDLLLTSVTEFIQLDFKTVNYSLLGLDENDGSKVNIVNWRKGGMINVPQQDLIVYQPSLNTREEGEQPPFVQIRSLVKKGGFLLLRGRAYFTQFEKLIFGRKDCELPLRHIIEMAESDGFMIASRKINGAGQSLVLLRKLKERINIRSEISVIGLNSKNFLWVEKLKKEIAQRQSHPEKGKIWLIDTNRNSSGLLGLVKCLQLEQGGEKIRCILDKTVESIDEIKSYVIDDRILKLDLALNVINENKDHGNYCHLNIDQTETMVLSEHGCLHVNEKRHLSSFGWIENECKVPKSSQIHAHGESRLIHIYYSALNFRDLMVTTGKIEIDIDSSVSRIGCEISGITGTGERVMGIVTGSGIATTARMTGNSIFWSVPDKWSLEQAATVPIVYSTCYYALIIRASLQRGETVLIHCGAGGVGLAAISICLSMECEVLVTVGKDKKKIYLLEQFPQLKEENIFNSRDLTFAQGVMKVTGGKGVDLVLNSLSEEKLQASVQLLANCGRFLELGKYDLKKDNSLGMSIFLKNISFLGICLERLFSMKPSPSSRRQIEMLKRLMNEGIENGTVRPIPSKTFKRDEVEEAFKYMKRGEHIGKLLIQMRVDERQKLQQPEQVKVLAMARTFFHSEKSYIIVGGIGGFGLELAYWMVTRGARNLILTSRSGVKNSFQAYSLDRLKQLGAKVIVSTLDAGHLHETNKLIDAASELGPVGGVFNLALVLHDRALVNQSEESFKKVTHCKVDATINLDRVTRYECPQLDHFVVFSSVASGFGNAGQSNYALANSSMETICEERRKMRLPSLAIQWGPIADVGVIAERENADLVIRGMAPQRIRCCISALDTLLASKEAIVTSFVRHSKDAERVAYGDDLTSQVCRVLGLHDPSLVSPDRTLSALGIDSLMATELKKMLLLAFDVTMTEERISSLTFDDLNAIWAQYRSAKNSHSDQPTNSSARTPK